MASADFTIAERLTTAERAFVLSGSPDDLAAGGYALGHKGLAQLDCRTTPHRFYLTEEGRRVRAILTARQA